MKWRQITFCQALVDRAAHRRADEAWLAEAASRGRFLVVGEDSRVLVTGEPAAPKLALVPAEEAPGGERLFLGEDSEAAYFAVVGELPSVAGTKAATLREVAAALDGYDAALLVEAVGLVNWRRSYQFSPLTGALLEPRSGGWELAAADGSGLIWPRTNPAVIVLVHDGVPGDAGQALLTRQAEWPAGRYSCLAGFVEPGESAEGAVHREVGEETGVVVWDVTYVASQPWPLPASLMLGFTAHGDPSLPVRVDTTELEDARWFTRGQLRSAGDQPAMLLPSRMSIAHQLVMHWRDEFAD